jgi:hypothetical protein
MEQEPVTCPATHKPCARWNDVTLEWRKALPTVNGKKTVCGLACAERYAAELGMRIVGVRSVFKSVRDEGSSSSRVSTHYEIGYLDKSQG